MSISVMVNDSTSQPYKFCQLKFNMIAWLSGSIPGQFRLDRKGVGSNPGCRANRCCN